MKFDILNRFTGAVQFTAEIDCNDTELTSVKIGLAVKLACKAGADLRGAELRGAYLGGADLRGAYLGGADLRGAYLGGAELGGAYLRGADLRGAYLGGAELGGAELGGAYLGGADLRGAKFAEGEWIVQGPLRSDGYAFMLTHFMSEGLRIKAGCRNFTLEDANAHWKATRAGTKLYDETNEIINCMFMLAWHRGLVGDDWKPILPAQKEAA